MTTVRIARRAIAASILLLLSSGIARGAPRLLSPNGGERLRVGSTATIRWDGVASTDTVMLEYSIDNGATWNMITNAATGLQHLWRNIPNTPSNRCLMRISSRGSVGDSVLYLSSLLPGNFLPDAVHDAEFSPDGTKVIGGGADGTVFIWDSFTGALLTTIPVEDRANIPSPPATPGITLIASVRYSPDGRFFATTGPLPDKTGAMVRIFDAATGARLREWRSDGISAIPSTETGVYSPDGTRFLVEGQRGGKVYNVADGSLVTQLKGYFTPTLIASMTACDWHPNGSEVIGALTGSSQVLPDIIISDPVTGDLLRSFTYPGIGGFFTVRYSPDGTRFITTSANVTGADSGRTLVCDALTGAVIHDIRGYATFPTSGVFSNNGISFATSGQDLGSPNWKLHLYDAASGNFVRNLGAIVAGMRSAEFSPDDARVLTACNDGVRIFYAPGSTAGGSDVSDSLWEIFIDGNPFIVISAPVITARQGERVDLPIYIDQPGAALGAGATRVDVTLRYNVSLLDPAGTTPRGTFTASERTIPLSFPIRSATDTLLGVVQFRAALGNDSTTLLDLSGAATDLPAVTVIEEDGLFRLSDLCREGGARLLNPNGTAALKLISSGGVSGGIEAEIETIEEGRTRLALYDIAGRMVRRFLDDDAPVGRWSFHLDLGGISQGNYFLVLETPAIRKSVAVEVAR